MERANAEQRDCGEQTKRRDLCRWPCSGQISTVYSIVKELTVRYNLVISDHFHEEEETVKRGRITWSASIPSRFPPRLFSRRLNDRKRIATDPRIRIIDELKNNLQIFVDVLRNMFLIYPVHSKLNTFISFLTIKQLLLFTRLIVIPTILSISIFSSWMKGAYKSYYYNEI